VARDGPAVLGQWVIQVSKLPTNGVRVLTGNGSRMTELTIGSQSWFAFHGMSTSWKDDSIFSCWDAFYTRRSLSWIMRVEDCSP
jgi:hypothetical protein